MHSSLLPREITQETTAVSWTPHPDEQKRATPAELATRRISPLAGLFAGESWSPSPQLTNSFQPIVSTKCHCPKHSDNILKFSIGSLFVLTLATVMTQIR
eukprot:1265529-Rhodomonas_salina.4